jgi:Na+/pantothenate symporter
MDAALSLFAGSMMAVGLGMMTVPHVTLPMYMVPGSFTADAGTMTIIQFFGVHMFLAGAVTWAVTPEVAANRRLARRVGWALAAAVAGGLALGAMHRDVVYMLTYLPVPAIGVVCAVGLITK